MTSRERMLEALSHRTPDRVPIDLGGNQTGIHKFAYQALLEHLGIEDTVAITEDGVENFTAFMPAELDDIERLMREEGVVQIRPALED